MKWEHYILRQSRCSEKASFTFLFSLHVLEAFYRLLITYFYLKLTTFHNIILMSYKPSFGQRNFVYYEPHTAEP